MLHQATPLDSEDDEIDDDDVLEDEDFDDEFEDDDLDDDEEEDEDDEPAAEQRPASPTGRPRRSKRRGLQPRPKELGPLFPSDERLERFRELGKQERHSPDELREVLVVLPAFVEHFLNDRMVKQAKATHRHARLGQAWSDEERSRLIDGIRAGRQIAYLARVHERTENAIRAEVKRLVDRCLLSSDDADWIARYETMADSSDSTRVRRPPR